MSIEVWEVQPNSQGQFALKVQTRRKIEAASKEGDDYLFSQWARGGPHRLNRAGSAR